MILAIHIEPKGIWLGNLGLVYIDLGQVEQATTYFAQALTIANAIGDRRYEGIWLGNLGLAHRSLEQIEQAITYYEQALAIAKEIGDRRNEWIWLDSLVLAYQNLERTDLPLNSSTLAQRVEELRNALQKTGMQKPRDSSLGWDQSWDQRWDQSWPQSWSQNGSP